MSVELQSFHRKLNTSILKFEIQGNLSSIVQIPEYKHNSVVTGSDDGIKMGPPPYQYYRSLCYIFEIYLKSVQ